MKSIPQGKKRATECRPLTSQPEEQTCFICNKHFTTAFHNSQHIKSRAHEDAAMFARRGAEAIIGHLSFHLTSKTLPPFTMKPSHLRELKEQLQVLDDITDEHREQLLTMAELRDHLDSYQYEKQAQYQWDRFLETILESSSRLDFAPPP